MLGYGFWVLVVVDFLLLSVVVYIDCVLLFIVDLLVRGRNEILSVRYLGLKQLLLFEQFHVNAGDSKCIYE